MYTRPWTRNRSSDFRTPLFWIQITTPCISIGHNYLIFYSKSLSLFFIMLLLSLLHLHVNSLWNIGRDDNRFCYKRYEIYIYIFYFYFETSSNKKFHIYLIHILPVLILYHISFFRRESTKNREIPKVRNLESKLYTSCPFSLHILIAKYILLYNHWTSS